MQHIPFHSKNKTLGLPLKVNCVCDAPHCDSFTLSEEKQITWYFPSGMMLRRKGWRRERRSEATPTGGPTASCPTPSRRESSVSFLFFSDNHFIGDLRWVVRFGLKWAKSVPAKSKHPEAASSKSMCTAVLWLRWGLIWGLLGSVGSC